MTKMAFADLIERRLAPFQVFVALAMLTVLVIDGVDIQLLSLLAPVIISEWGSDRASFGPPFAAALFGMSIGSLAGGWLGDRAGRLRALILFVLIFGSATALASLSQNVMQLTVLRVMGGIGFGAASPNALALASEWMPRRYQSKVVAMLSIGTPVGGMLGATLVLLLEPAWGWNGTFLLCGLATIGLALLLVAFMRESPACLLQKGRPEAATRTISILTAAGEEPVPVHAGHSAQVEVRVRTRLLDPTLTRLNVGAGVSFFFIALAAYATIAWTTVILTDAGFAMAQALKALFAYNLGSAAAALCTGFLVDRFGSRSVLCAVSGLLAVVTTALGFVLAGRGSPGSAEVLAATVLVGLSGAAAGSAIAAIYAMMVAGYPPECRGAGMGLGLTLGRAGGIVLSIGGGLLLGAGPGSAWPFLAVLALSAIFAMAGAMISDRHVQPLRASEPRGALAGQGSEVSG